MLLIGLFGNTTKVNNLKQLNPKNWWHEVKRLSGMDNNVNLKSCIQIENAEHLSLKELANLINNSFLEPMVDFSPLNSINYTVDNSGDQIPDLATPWSTYLKLISFNPSKAPGPDNIPNRIFRDFADILAYPVSVLLNSSFQDQKLPDMWKLASVTPVPKNNITNLFSVQVG